MPVIRQETDPAVCGRCGGMGYVRDSVRYCSGCGMTTVGCTCMGDRRRSAAESGDTFHLMNSHR